MLLYSPFLPFTSGASRKFEPHKGVRVQNPWSGGAGFERSGPLHLFFHTPLQRAAPLQVIFWIQSGVLLQNCQKNALIPWLRCGSNM